MHDAPRLRINELYRSIQGETLTSGLPCTFVRLSGCDLRCRWCDSDFAFDEGSWMTIGEVADAISQLGEDLVLITGGEPLLQPAVHALIALLLDGGTRVLLETGGHLPIDGVDQRVELIMDIKCPGSGEAEHNDTDNLSRLKPTDQIKLVIADQQDYAWARDRVQAEALHERCHVIFSPVHGELEPERLARWILEDRLPVRLGLQLHKLIWAPGSRGV